MSFLFVDDICDQSSYPRIQHSAKDTVIDDD